MRGKAGKGGARYKAALAARAKGSASPPPSPDALLSPLNPPPLPPLLHSRRFFGPCDQAMQGRSGRKSSWRRVGEERERGKKTRPPARCLHPRQAGAGALLRHASCCARPNERRRRRPQTARVQTSPPPPLPRTGSVEGRDGLFPRRLLLCPSAASVRRVTRSPRRVTGALSPFLGWAPLPAPAGTEGSRG